MHSPESSSATRSSTNLRSWPPGLAQPLPLPCGVTKIVPLPAVSESLRSP
ncbi:hypothetical protein [Lentzea cavernae]